MNSGTNSGSATANCEYQELMSEMFHDLSQPLSTLSCLVEINLLLSRTAKQWRQDLKIALKQVHAIVWLIRALRELWQAGTGQQDEDRQVLPLDGCLRDVVADLLPIAELAKVRLSLISSSECQVNFQTSRLRQGFFHLLSFAVDSSASGADVKITLREEDEARVTVAISRVIFPEIGPPGSIPPAAGGAMKSVDGKQRDLKRRVGLAIARRIFEGVGGVLQTEEGGERLRIDVLLPVKSCPQ
jgi:light-regulated signal transduction histidine kinase (bacteriophytochrome)